MNPGLGKSVMNTEKRSEVPEAIKRGDFWIIRPSDLIDSNHGELRESSEEGATTIEACGAGDRSRSCHEYRIR